MLGKKDEAQPGNIYPNLTDSTLCYVVKSSSLVKFTLRAVVLVRGAPVFRPVNP